MSILQLGTADKLESIEMTNSGLIFFFKSHNSLTLSFPGDRLSSCQHECSRDPSSCPITGNQYDLLEKSIGVKGHPR